MQIISQGNDYIVQFDLYGDLQNIANNVIGKLTYDPSQLTLVSMTVTPSIGTQSTLDTNQYLFGTVLPNKHYAVACVFTLLQESPLIPITWTISTSNPETTLVNNSKTINLVDYLDGLLASDICNNLKGCVVTTQVRFVEVLPNGEWSWENYNPITNTVVSTFTTPATSAQTITSTDSSVIVSGSDLSVTHTVNPDGSVTLNDGTIIPAPTPQLTPAEICASIAATCNATLGSFTPTVNPDGSTTYTAVFTGNDGVPTNVTFTIPAAQSVTVVSADANNDITPGTDGGAYFKETITEITGTQTTGKTIGTYINEAGAPTEIKESLVAFTPTTNGVQLVSEDGTVFPLIFEFNDTTPSAPLLDIKLNGTTVSSIPLNSYDVNITTTGGFVFNPLTDEIIITETNGEPHVIDLTPLRTTLTSSDSSVGIIPSVNPDGSTNYDLKVKVHTNQVETVPYTGVELPSIAGVNIGDTTDVQFTDGIVVNYTWTGSTWITDFQQIWAEKRICLNTTTPTFITTTVLGQNDVEIFFNFDGNPFDITSFKINGTELIISPINIYDAGNNYVYTNQLVPLFNNYMTTNGYVGSIDDDIDNNGGIFFQSLSGMLSALTFEIVTDESGNINTYTQTSILIITSVPVDINNPTIAEVQAWASANLSLLDQTNGTKLVYFVAGDGGSCDVPDYEWTLNKGSELITLSNKRVFNTKTIYICTNSGSDITGKRGYREFPFKTLSTAKDFYQEGDKIEYLNSNETISGLANINSATNSHNIDFDNGIITLAAGGYALIGAHNYTDLSTKNAHIISRGKFILNKPLFNSVNGKFTFDAKDVESYRYMLSSKDDVNINIDNLISTTFYPLGFWSGSNKKVNINVKNIEITNPAISGYIPGIFNPEVVNGEDTNNNTITCRFDNIKLNTSYGCAFFIYSGPNWVKNSLFKFEANNFMQSSAYTSYPLGSPPSSRSLLFITGTSTGARLDNNKIYLQCNNQDSDISVQQEGMGSSALINNCFISVNVANSIVRKLYSFRFGNTIFDNTKEIVTGNYENLSTLPIIFINGLSLTNGSVLEFNGNFKSDIGIDLSGLTIDATSKIIFKGRYELGVGNFNISGVTGAGANNIIFEDCTIITTNLECITSTTSKNITVRNTSSNVLTGAANVTEVGESIVRNVNYK